VLYESEQRLQWPGMHYPLALLGVAVCLSWSTSWLACDRHLRQLEGH